MELEPFANMNGGLTFKDLAKISSSYHPHILSPRQTQVVSSAWNLNGIRTKQESPRVPWDIHCRTPVVMPRFICRYCRLAVPHLL